MCRVGVFDWKDKIEKLSSVGKGNFKTIMFCKVEMSRDFSIKQLEKKIFLTCCNLCQLISVPSTELKYLAFINQ